MTHIYLFGLCDPSEREAGRGLHDHHLWRNTVEIPGLREARGLAGGSGGAGIYPAPTSVLP